MPRKVLIATALAGMLAVIFGAFGAHGLKPLLTPYQISIWEKGVQYQIYHALALFMCYLYLRKEYSVYIRNAAICFVLGILCFSGSLYLLATIDLTHLPVVVIGPITPIGGFFFIAGWSMVLIQAIKKEE
ncbi:MAG TPA: DUF423 domain-containing protein [Chitinophagales bacterium]|nr:DUF423 domain-containing protein [Chitinophagales bacterium]